MSSFVNTEERMRHFEPGKEPPPVVGPPMPERPAVQKPAPIEPGKEPKGRPAPPSLDKVSARSFWDKARTLLGTIIGPKVDPNMYRKRMVACMQCPDIDIVHKRYGDRLYCGACSCGRWWPARLTRKNRHEFHVCPLGRHPGQSQDRPDCPSCGGGQRRKGVSDGV